MYKEWIFERHMLEDMVKDEEEHIDWIETQMETISSRAGKLPEEQLHRR